MNPIPPHAASSAWFARKRSSAGFVLIICGVWTACVSALLAGDPGAIPPPLLSYSFDETGGAALEIMDDAGGGA